MARGSDADCIQPEDAGKKLLKTLRETALASLEAANATTASVQPQITPMAVPRHPTRFSQRARNTGDEQTAAYLEELEAICEGLGPVDSPFNRVAWARELAAVNYPADHL